MPNTLHERVLPGAADPQREAPGRLSWLTRRPETFAVLVGLLGLFIQVVGYARGWAGESAAVPLWYVGFLTIIAPYVALLCVPERTARQRLGAGLALSVTVYASWLLSNPIISTRFDENLHVTTLVDLIEHAEFFQLNTMLPVSPHFPGLELAAAGVHWLTGLPLIVCQTLVVLTARITFVTALFLVVARIAGSARAGGFAVLAYAASPQFYFFNAQFSYQTVAIAMVMASLYLLIRAFDSPQRRPWGLLAAVQVCLAALSITHHLTSWVMLATLWFLVVLFAVSRDRRRFSLTLITAELATTVVALWTAVIAPLLIGYLRPIFGEATSQLAGVFAGDTPGRSIGSSSDGTAAPTWELAVMGSSVLLWCVLLLPAGWAAWRSGSIGRSPARYFPLLIALAFPITQASRFSSAAGEVGDRASTFIFMAMALVVGAWLARRVDALGAAVVIPGALVLVLGGTILGSGPDWQRVPGPFLAGAQQRSIDATTLDVARWSGRYLPDGSVIAADLTFGRLIPNFADVTAATDPGGFASVTPMFISERLDNYSLQLILRNDIDFVVIDTRLVGETVRSGAFFEGGSGYGETAATITPAMVDKFEDFPGFDLVLDGPVRVYDVRAVRGVPADFEDRPDPAIPGEWQPWQAAASGGLLLLVLALRRRSFDVRRFRLGSALPLAMSIPAAMLVGALGVVMAFEPIAGLVVAAIGAFALVRLTRQPDEPMPRPSTPGFVLGAIAVMFVALIVGLAVVSTYQGLYVSDPLPPPLTVVEE